MNRTNHRRWFNFDTQVVSNGLRHGVDLDVVLADDADMRRSPVFIDIDVGNCSCVRGNIPTVDIDCPVL